MFVAHRALEKRAHHASVTAGGRITSAQARLAARIGPKGTRLTDLAAQAQATKQTAAISLMNSSAAVMRSGSPAREMVVVASSVSPPLQRPW